MIQDRRNSQIWHVAKARSGTFLTRARSVPNRSAEADQNRRRAGPLTGMNPFHPTRSSANVYYVGTKGLASFLLNASAGYFDAARATLILREWRGLAVDMSYWFSKPIDLGSGYTNVAYDKLRK